MKETGRFKRLMRASKTSEGFSEVELRAKNRKVSIFNYVAPIVPPI
jgi:hypothetical protein